MLSEYLTYQEPADTMVFSANGKSRAKSGCSIVLLIAAAVSITSIFLILLMGHYAQTWSLIVLGLTSVFLIFAIPLALRKNSEATPITLTVTRSERLFVYRNDEQTVTFHSADIEKIEEIGRSSLNVIFHLKNGEKLFVPWQLYCDGVSSFKSYGVATFLDMYEKELNISDVLQK